MGFQYLEQMGVYIFLISSFIGIILFLKLKQPNNNYSRWDSDTENYKSLKWISIIGVITIAFLVYYRYFNSNGGIGIVDILTALKDTSITFRNSEFFWLYFITFVVTVFFPLPTILALTFSFIAIESIDVGVIVFIILSTLQVLYFVYKDEGYIDIFDFSEAFEALIAILSGIASIIKILSKIM